MRDEENEFFEVPEFESYVQEFVRPVDPIKTEQVRQAGISFNAAIVVGILGALVILAGVVALLFSNLQTAKGSLAAGVGIVMELMSFFGIKLHRETNNRLDEIRRDENAMQLVSGIKDPVLRDQAINELVRSFRRTVPVPKKIGKLKP